jgi:enoyl-CoA hydratase/carnithine racemase
VTESTGELVKEVRGPVLVLRLNRPQARNALTLELIAGIGRAVTEAEADPAVRAVVLTGTGDRAFCAGMDLRAFAEGEQLPAGAEDDLAAFQRLLDGDVGVPLVGAANATALAGGFELLLACDLVVASSHAELGLPEVKRGLFAAGSGTSLGTRIPLAVALEMTLTGDSITAERAHGLGLVNAVVEPRDVLATALALAGKIARNAPLGVTATKELVRLAVADPARVAGRREELRHVVFSSEDAKEGAVAFVEKRPPVWQGR